METPFRLGIVFTHPTQHHGPLWRKLSEQSGLEVKVLYLCDENQGSGDQYLGKTSQPWDVDLLGGYQYEYLPDLSGKVPAQQKKSSLAPSLLQHISRKELDAVFMQSFVNYSYRLTALLCKLRGIPLIMQNDATIISDGRYSRLRQMILPIMYPWMLSQADYWLSCGDHNEIHLRHYGVSDNKIIRGCHPVDGDRFKQAIASNPDEIQNIRRDLAHRADAIVYGFVAKYTDRKKPFEFIDAIAKARQQDPRVRGIMLGGGVLETEINQRLATLDGAVINVGFVNQSKLPLYYAAMDAFVLTSRLDPHPLVTSEAMVSGCPVILSDGCGNWGYSDTVIHYYNGLVYPRGSVDALANAMLALTDAETRHRYSENARKTFEQQSLYTAVDSFLEVVRRLTASQTALPVAKAPGEYTSAGSSLSEV